MYKNENYYTIYKRKNNKNGITYGYYCYNKEGKRVHRSTGCKRRSEAIEVINERIKNGTLVYPLGFIGIKLAHEDIKNITLEEFCKPFYIEGTCPLLKEEKARGKKITQEYIRTSRKNLDKHILPYLGEYPIKSLSYSLLSEWLINLPTVARIKGTTANNALKVLRNVLEYARLHDLLDKNVAADVKPIIEKDNSYACFTHEQIIKLFNTPWDNRIAYVACLLAASTGMRMGEIRALQMNQVKPDRIIINASYSDREGRKCTKSGKPREVPITQHLYKEIQIITYGRKLAPDSYIFWVKGNNPVCEVFILKELYKNLAKCKIPKETDGSKLCFHSFRHYFNTRLVATNASGELTRSIIGHASSAMTDRYTHLRAEDMYIVNKLQESLLRQ